MNCAAKGGLSLDPIVTMKLVFPSGQTLEVAVPRSMTKATSIHPAGYAIEGHAKEARLPTEKLTSSSREDSHIYS